MADASSIRKAKSLAPGTQAGAPFYAGAIRFYNNAAYINTGSQWVGLGAVTLNVPVQVAADAIDQNVFVADKAYQVVSVSEVHGVAGSDGSAVTLAVMKCTGTQAPASGVNVLTATFDLKGTANTVQAGTLSATPANSVLAAGNRLAFDVTGTPTAYAGGIVTIVLQPV